MTAETKKWYQDDNKRKAFWQSANNLAKSKGVPTSEAHRWVHQELGISTIKDWTDTADAALKILNDAPEWKPEDVADPVPPSSTAPASDAVDIDEALGRKPASPQPKFSADAWAAWVSVTAKKTELTQAQIFELICEQLQLTGKPVIARPSEFDGTLEELAQVFENSYIRTSKPMPGDVSQETPQATAQRVQRVNTTPIQHDAGNPFMPATLAGSYLRMAITGPSGSGKTFTALQIATHMMPDARVAVICTERGSARKYARLFKFDVLELRNFAPQHFIKAIKDAQKYKYDVLIVDSLSHEWNGAGGILSIVDNNNNNFGAWKTATPLHQEVIDTLLDAKLHVIVTLRSKTGYAVEEVDKGSYKKTNVRKLGLEPIQREGVEYEFDIFAKADMDNTLTIEKSRCVAVPNGSTYTRAGDKLATELATWLNEADDVAGAA